MNKNKENKYPTLKIMTFYPLLGGFVSGFLACLIFRDNIPYFNPISLEFLVPAFGLSFIIGFIPFLLTGIVLSWFKIRVLKILDYIKAFVVGFCCIFLFVIFMMIIMYGLEKAVSGMFANDGFEIFWSIIISTIGGISSTILAKFILPKY